MVGGHRAGSAHRRRRLRRWTALRSWLAAVAGVTALLVPVQLGGQASAEGGVPGTLDATFDTDGIAVNELVSHLFSVDAAARLPDGRILVLADGLVWRLFSDGTVDTSFDADGVLKPALPAGFTSPDLLALRPGGAGFVLSSSFQSDTNCRAGKVAEFDANGAIVPGFGTNGVACINFPDFNGAEIADLVVQDDGRIVVLGNYNVTGEEGGRRIALARLNSTGATVNTVQQPSSGQYDRSSDLVVQPDGKIVVVGRVDFINTNDVLLSRYDGGTLALDTTFGGGDGLVRRTASMYYMYGPIKVAVAVDGSNVVGMSVVVGGESVDGVLRLEQLIFDGAGGPGADQVVDIAGDGLVNLTDLTATATGYVAIARVDDLSAPYEDLVAAVSLARDAADTEPGYVAFQNADVKAGPAVLLPDGKLLHAGVLNGPGGEQLSLNRLVDDPAANPRTARLDPTIGSSFGQSGFLTHNATTRDRGEAVAVQPDGKVLVGGRSSSADGGTAGVGAQGFVLRYKEDGSLDGTFGGSPSGVVFLGFQVYGVAALPDGRAVAVGTEYIVGEGTFSVRAAAQRLLADGRPDPTWNNGAPTFVTAGGGLFDVSSFGDVAVQPDGKVVAVGQRGASLMIARFDPDGTIDETFGESGMTLIEEAPGNTTGAEGHGVALQPDGRIVVTGALDGRLVVARLDAGGTPDPSFAGPPGPYGPGVLADDLVPGVDSEQGIGRDVALRPDGRIVVAGDLVVQDCSAGVACFTRRFAIAVQYQPAGTRDGGFGDGGLVVVVGPAGSEGQGVAVDGAGNVLVAGSAPAAATGSDVMLARLLSTGAPDPAFGTGGVVLTNAGQDDAGSGLALAPDGRILVTGTNTNTRGDRVITARYEPGAALQCAPSPLDFGGVVLTTGPATQAVTCTNTGPSRLTITAVDTSGADAAEFEPLADDCLRTLSPGESCQVPVAFTPTAIGPRTATLAVTHSGQGESGPISVGLTGTGIARDTTLTFTPAPLVFAERLGLSTSPAQAVTVTNTGTVPVTVNGVSIENDPAGDFAISASTCTGTTLAPGDTCQVSVTFTPKAPGGRTATLRFDDTGVGTPHRPALTGTGSTPTLSVNPGLGRIGSVTGATGANFPPNRSVTLAWADPLTLTTGGFPEPAFTVTTGANGALTASVLVFPKSRIGTRMLLATVEGFSANAPFLVTPGTLQGPDMIVRR